MKFGYRTTGRRWSPDLDIHRQRRRVSFAGTAPQTTRKIATRDSIDSPGRWLGKATRVYQIANILGDDGTCRALHSSPPHLRLQPHPLRHANIVTSRFGTRTTEHLKLPRHSERCEIERGCFGT